MSTSEADCEWPLQPVGPLDYFRKHWRGQLSVAHSVWINTFLVILIVNFLLGYLDTHELTPFAPLRHVASVSVTMLVLVLSLIPLGVWQVIGVWRSAGHRMVHGGGRTGSTTARLFCVVTILYLLQKATVVVQDAPAHVEMVRIALGYNLIGDFEVRMVDAGSGVLIEGKMEAGLVRKFRQSMAEYPEASYVQLDSRGGWRRVGLRLYREINHRGMNTYVESRCQSACAIAFLGGNARIVAPEATIGFHKGTLGARSRLAKKEYRGSERLIANLMRDKGVSDGFVRKVWKMPPGGSWTPSVQALARADVVTHTCVSGTLHPTDRESN